MTESVFAVPGEYKDRFKWFTQSMVGQLRGSKPGFIPIVYKLGWIKNGVLRLTTVFEYEDGGIIDLYVQPPESVLRLTTVLEYADGDLTDLCVQPPKSEVDRIVLTDLGSTIGNLLSGCIDVDIKPEHKAYIKSLCEEYGVTRKGGMFTLEVPEPAELHFYGAVMLLGQACADISDLLLIERLESNRRRSGERDTLTKPENTDSGTDSRTSETV